MGVQNSNRAETRNRFIGREKELSAVSAWLENPNAPFAVISITGVGGIGKSTLMSEMQRVATEAAAYGVWLDGRACANTPGGFLEYVTAAVQLETMQQTCAYPLQPLLEANPGKRFMLCVDNYEELVTLEGWLIEGFIPKLPSSGLIIVLASRAPLSLAWKTNRLLGECLTEMPLAYFTQEESLAYIEVCGTFHSEEAGKMIRIGGGHPLGLALTVAAVVKGSKIPDDDAVSVSQSISANMLREITAAELQPLVDVLTVLQSANQEMLSRVLQFNVTFRQYQELRELSFVRSGQEGLSLHDVARIHLLRDLSQREPQRLLALRRRAAKLLHGRLRSADRINRRRLASQMLFLCKDMFPLHRLYADFSVDIPVSKLEPIRQGDLPALHELLQRWCEYSVDPWQSEPYHLFLDEIVDSFPESISVLRNEEGVPAAMFIITILHKGTAVLLEKYFPAEIKECCNREELDCDPEEADTYYAVLGTATDQLPGYTREELVGLLILDRLALLGEGARVTLVVSNPHLKVFLKKLGFQMRPTVSRDCDTSFAISDVMELDLRNTGDFGDWVISFFSDRSEGVPELTMARPSGEDMRKMLSSLRSPADLQQFAAPFRATASGYELQSEVLSLLQDEQSALAARDREILYTAFWEHAGSPSAAAIACNMSRATFYRHLRMAVSNFAEVFASRTGFLLQDETGVGRDYRI